MSSGSASKGFLNSFNDGAKLLGKSMRSVLGSANDRRIKKFQARVEAINALEPEIKKLSDQDLIARTEQFKQQFQACLLYTSPSPRDS